LEDGYAHDESGQANPKGGKATMTVASVTEISAASSEGFEAAVREGIERANRTLRNVEGAWVKDMNVLIEDGQIRAYKVNLAITFVLEDGT
jgi:flavin-binding protein dodecin